MTRTAIAAIVTTSVAVFGIVGWGVKRYINKQASDAETKREANAA